MANAVVGRVLLIPKGDYSEAATYNMLDLVRYNNKSWVCKQNCTGQTPQEDSYWQLMASDGADGSYCYIRYSANSDGTGFVSAPTASTIYIGFYTGDSETAPTDKALYTWSKYVGTGAWSDITGKPFSSVGSAGLKVTSGVLDVDPTKVVLTSGNAATASRLQRINVTGAGASNANKWTKVGSFTASGACTGYSAILSVTDRIYNTNTFFMSINFRTGSTTNVVDGGSLGLNSFGNNGTRDAAPSFKLVYTAPLFELWFNPQAFHLRPVITVINETSISPNLMTYYSNQPYQDTAPTGTVLACTPLPVTSDQLPTASSSVKGGIKIGANLTMDGDTLNATGGGGGIAPSNVANIVAKERDCLIKLTWQDPNDTYVDGNLLCTWKGTKVVYKTDSYPANETDGTLVIDSTTRNAYENDELSITGLTNDTPYYIAFFPYSDQGVVNKNIANRITATPQTYVLYGYKRTKADSNPATRLVATDMAVGMGKATMNTTTGAIDLASWTNAWFVEGNKPVMMKYDGTIDYELDPNDYTKKADGVTASDVANSSYAGNAMALFPTCWVKRWEDSTYEYFQVCDVQLDSDFKAYAHQRQDGSIMEWFARSIYDGANVSSKIRSISGLAPCNTVEGNTQLTYAQANGSLWDSDTWSRVALIWDLLRLMSLNDNVQNAYGYGYYTGMTAASSLNNSGTGNTKGQFYGKLANDVVKVFHVENFWGNIYKLIQGLLYNTSGKYGVKMCRPYSTTGIGYTATTFGLSGTSGGYQSAHNMSELGLLPTTASGSDSTYIPDGVSWDTTQQNFARFGGSGGSGLLAGCEFALHILLSYSSWNCGLGLTCEQHLTA